MPLPSQLHLINALLKALRLANGTLNISGQEENVAKILALTDAERAEMQSPRRTKLNYRLAWARNYLKRLGCVQNSGWGIWSLTEKGHEMEAVSESDIKSLNRTETETSGTGIESEEIEAEITEPFDPTLIRVESKPATLGQLISRIEHGEIDLAPDFQRKGGIWNEGAQSRLIESLLVRIPIPAFYFDASNEDRWLIVDGLQRLSVLKRFVLEKVLVLQGMEFLRNMNGKGYDQLPRALQRRISETGVTVFLIDKNTPSEVKFNIFKRINTGGLPLSAQEIRHALNQGRVTALLSELAGTDEFLQATDYGIRDERMADRECVLRFLAFTISAPEDYKATEFDGFLSDKMGDINKMDDARIADLTATFKRAMHAANQIFERDAFRKPFILYGRRMPINKAIFEVWAVNLGELAPDKVDVLVSKRKQLGVEFATLCEKPRFSAAITQGTGDPAKVRLRFVEVKNIITKVINGR